MKYSPIVILSCCMSLFIAMPVMAQSRSELSFSIGGGSLDAGTAGGGGTSVVSLSYQYHITRHISAEGALDFFNYKFLTGPSENPYVYKDDYAGAEAAVVYHFRPSRQTGRWLPFVAAGIGKTTTDFTEIAASPYYRFGAGVAYNFTGKLGLRFEARDELNRGLWTGGSPNGNLLSLRCGIVYRF